MKYVKRERIAITNVTERKNDALQIKGKEGITTKWRIDFVPNFPRNAP